MSKREREEGQLNRVDYVGLFVMLAIFPLAVVVAIWAIMLAAR